MHIKYNLAILYQAIAFQITEQDPKISYGFRTTPSDFALAAESMTNVELTEDTLFLRGNDDRNEAIVVFKRFRSDDERDEYVQMLTNALDAVATYAP